MNPRFAHHVASPCPVLATDRAALERSSAVRAAEPTAYIAAAGLLGVRQPSQTRGSDKNAAISIRGRAAAVRSPLPQRQGVLVRSEPKLASRRAARAARPQRGDFKSDGSRSPAAHSEGGSSRWFMRNEGGKKFRCRGGSGLTIHNRSARRPTGSLENAAFISVYAADRAGDTSYPQYGASANKCSRRGPKRCAPTVAPVARMDTDGD